MLTLSDCDGGVGEDHETGDDLQLERVELLMPLLDSGTEGGVVRATVKVGSAQHDALEQERFSRSDLRKNDTFSQNCTTLAWTSPTSSISRSSSTAPSVFSRASSFDRGPLALCLDHNFLAPQAAAGET